MHEDCVDPFCHDLAAERGVPRPRFKIGDRAVIGALWDQPAEEFPSSNRVGSMVTILNYTLASLSVDSESRYPWHVAVEFDDGRVDPSINEGWLHPVINTDSIDDVEAFLAS